MRPPMNRRLVAYVALLATIIFLLVGDIPVLLCAGLAFGGVVIAGYYAVTRVHLVRVAAAVLGVSWSWSRRRCCSAPGR